MHVCMLITTHHLLHQAYFARIQEVNLGGPALRAIIETSPSALAQAAELDRERRKTGPRSALHGILILLKDNIATLHSEGDHRCCILGVVTLTSIMAKA